jgi:hypothetical protein
LAAVFFTLGIVTFFCLPNEASSLQIWPLAFALIFLFLGFVTLDAAVLKQPGLFFIAALDKIAPYLSQL